MNGFHPTVERGDKSIEVIAGRGTKILFRELICVLDHDEFSELGGIEILDFESQLGGTSIGPSPTVGYPRWSYDPEVDAAYIRVSGARAQAQISSTAVATISASGQLVSLRVAWDCNFFGVNPEMELRKTGLVP
ncbi:MAG: hypothetical protein H7201_02595 [Candidatus Saccharibacteria bacterium]|nr:hypothetical protein [Microbacteriaceae bacterium]